MFETVKMKSRAYYDSSSFKSILRMNIVELNCYYPCITNSKPPETKELAGENSPGDDGEGAEILVKHSSMVYFMKK